MRLASQHSFLGASWRYHVSRLLTITAVSIEKAMSQFRAFIRNTFVQKLHKLGLRGLDL